MIVIEYQILNGGTFLSNCFQREDEIKIAQRRSDKFCERYHFPKVTIQSVFIQENMRIVQAVAVPGWETECLQKTGCPHLLQQRAAHPVVKAMIQQYLWPEYKKQYRQNIRYSDYKMIWQSGQYQLFGVGIFEYPLFCKTDTDNRSLENQQASLLARKLRDLTGRGPQKIKAVCMSSGLMVYVVNGLISRGNKLFASQSTKHAEMIEKITEYHLQEAFNSMYTTDGGRPVESVNLIDLENDFTISLVFAKTEQPLV